MKTLRTLLICFCCLALCGCLSKYVPRNYYVLSAGNAGAKTTSAKKPLLLVNRTTLAAQYDQLFFLYRTSNNQFVTDYYNGFLVSPAEQFDSILVKYLKNHSKFYPITIDVPVAAKFVLQTKITELYADYHDRNAPKAVFAVHFIMTQSIDGASKILLDRTFRSTCCLQAKTTESLVAGWDYDLQIILHEVAKEINKKQVTSESE